MLGALACGVLFLPPADARMYQWANPHSGTVQLSGTPPAWYRAATSGPRTLVFEDGQLIDDTGVGVSEPHRLALRDDAFGQTQSPAQVAPSAQPEQASIALRDALEDAASGGVDINAVADAFAVEQLRESETASGGVEATVAELKSLLDAWDSQRLQEAKALLRSADPLR